MNTSLTPEATRAISDRLRSSNAEFARIYSGETGRRQPVHVVYGGAHLFKSDTPPRLGALALRALEQFAADASEFARAVGFAGADDDERLVRTIYERVQEKL